MSRRGKRSSGGYVYLLHSELGQYKIGMTTHLEKRLLSFGVTLPFKVELVHSIPCGGRLSEAESQLHQEFAEKRIAGEWFALTGEDVTYISKLVFFGRGSFWIKRDVPLTDEEVEKELAIENAERIANGEPSLYFTEFDEDDS